ncbi:zonadhesin-like [Cydia amplana]|uniref:zonadhesin-like n=1 Tax=Cydia amplana TaxID=1869771 RepID=UPI002FE5B37A
MMRLRAVWARAVGALAPRLVRAPVLANRRRRRRAGTAPPAPPDPPDTPVATFARAPTCPANEVYSTCIQSSCTARNCSQLGKPVPCIKIDPKYCIKGCVCKEGYLRNAKGICVPKDQCNTPTCPANEVYSTCIQSSCTARNCSQLGKPVPCIKIDPKYCIKGCVCKEGYLRNAKGICVPKDQCNTPTCPANEVYSTCIQSSCTARNCSQLGKPVPCIKIDPKYCIKGCVCKEGYLRNAKGICVPKDQCNTPTCPANEVYSTCIQSSCTARNCSQLGKPVPCIKINPKYCIKGCVCKEGYLRNAKGICVPKDQCNTPTCPANEVYSTCIQSSCTARNCSQLGKPVPCIKIDPKYCIKGCVCKEGYLRNAKGICVPKDQCNTPTCPANEVYSTCIQSSCTARNCSQLGKPVPCIKIDPKYCIKGCVCKEGYLRNAKGICVPKDQCNTPTCPANEVYSTCIQSSCTARNCSQLGKPVPCIKIDPKYCIKGCVCKEGYLRNAKGICVPKDQCNTPTCPANEVYSTCIQSSCTARNCSQLGKPVPCIKIDPKYWIKGCVCKEGYLRNAKGICVPNDQCNTPTCPANEVYSACIQSSCTARNCSQLRKPVPCIKIDPKYCIKGCVCKEGYLRNAKGICVPKDQCNTPTCPANEVYSTCIQSSCTARNCSQLGKPVPCIRIDPKYCIKGCVCKNGYLRNAKGICVPKDQCNSKFGFYGHTA